MITTIGLVACSKTKLNHAAPARELYTSPLFRAASAYCERTYDRWFILSAKHGLVDPDQILEPYDLTLSDLDRRLLRTWGTQVRTQWQRTGISTVAVGQGWSKRGDDDIRFFMHAGRLYRTSASFRADLVEAPVERLRIGEQIAWYAAQSGGAS